MCLIDQWSSFPPQYSQVSQRGPAYIWNSRNRKQCCCTLQSWQLLQILRGSLNKSCQRLLCWCRLRENSPYLLDDKADEYGVELYANLIQSTRSLLSDYSDEWFDKTCSGDGYHSSTMQAITWNNWFMSWSTWRSLSSSLAESSAFSSDSWSGNCYQFWLNKWSWSRDLMRTCTCVDARHKLQSRQPIWMMIDQITCSQTSSATSSWTSIRTFWDPRGKRFLLLTYCYLQLLIIASKQASVQV